MKKQIAIGIAVVLVIALGVVAIRGRNGSTGTPPELIKVSVRMKWFFAGTMTGWFAGKEEGVFRQHGIDLTINPGGPQNSSIKLVAAGSDDFGVAGADEVLLARAKGIPVVALAVIFKESPVCYISRAEAGITKPEDFRGKKIEVSYGENAEYLFRALLKKAKLTKADYTEVPYTFNVAPFLEGKVDVSPAYAMDQAIVIEKQGVKLNKLFARNFGINPYADVIIATEQTIRERPDLVKRFVAAAIAAQAWAIQNRDKAVDDLIKSVPDLKRPDQVAVWEATVPYIVPGQVTDAIGVMTLERWQDTERVLLGSGILTASADLRSAFTTSFVPSPR